MNRTQTASPIGDLRREIARLERWQGPAKARRAVLSSGAQAIDGTLPEGGLPCGSLHELAGRGPEVEHGSAAALFAAGLLSRLPGPVVWVLNRRDLFAPAMCQSGLPMRRVLFVEAGRSVLLAMEEALRAPGLAGVVGELSGRLSLTTSRRLQLAAESSGVTAFALRRSRQFDDPALSEPTAAVTRWRIARLPAGPPVPHAPDVPGLGRARWQLDLVRCRGGEAGSWTVEACDAQGRLNLVADLADRSATPQHRRRAAG